MKKNKEYESISLKQLNKTNNINKFLFVIGFICFILFGGISFLFGYSIDPVLAYYTLALILGCISILLVNLYFYGKLIMLLRLIAGDEDESR